MSKIERYAYFFKFSPSDGSKLDLTCLFKLKIF